MYFPTILATIGFFAVAQACNPAQLACGNQNGAPGPDGAIFVCNSSGNFVFSAQCGGPTCCHQENLDTAFCLC